MSRERESTASTLAIAYVSTGVGQACNQIYYFLLLKVLSVADVGLYSWGVAVATIGAYIGDLGFSTFLVGELSSRRYSFSAFLQVLIPIRLLLAPIGFSALILWWKLTSPPVNENRVIILICATYLCQLFDGALFSWLQVCGRQSVANILNATVPAFRIALLLLVLALTPRISLLKVVSLNLATQVLGSIVLGFYAWRVSHGPLSDGPGSSPGVMWREFVKRGPKLALMYGFNILQARLDWLLVAAFVSDIALAHYSIANRVLEFAMLLAAICAKTCFPWMSVDSSGQGVRRIGLLRKGFIIAAVCVGLHLYLWANPLVQIIFHGKYAEAGPSIIILSSAAAVFMVNQFFFYMLLAARREGQYALLLLLATTVQVAVNVYFLPRCGIVAAAGAMFAVGWIVHFGLLYLLSKTHALTSDEVFKIGVYLLLEAVLCAAVVLAALTPFVSALVFTPVLLLGGFYFLLDPADRREVVTRTLGFFQNATR